MFRFIPAGAGNTSLVSIQRPVLPVYPRWRGEHCSVWAMLNAFDGLSPLARGTLSRLPSCRWIARFIPAGAGNTNRHQASASVGTVYPRWRGEHLMFCAMMLTTFGLSPLARGTQQPRKLDNQFMRFIPAGAGNTSERPQHNTRQPVYPRWRGEHSCVPCIARVMPGLSPLARGTLRRFSCVGDVWRFIPAGAGNTINGVLGYESQLVYPRWRGEHRGCTIFDDGQRGLSPLARGTHPDRPLQ